KRSNRRFGLTTGARPIDTSLPSWAPLLRRSAHPQSTASPGHTAAGARYPAEQATYLSPPPFFNRLGRLGKSDRGSFLYCVGARMPHRGRLRNLLLHFLQLVLSRIMGICEDSSPRPVSI